MSSVRTFYYIGLGLPLLTLIQGNQSSSGFTMQSAVYCRYWRTSVSSRHSSAIRGPPIVQM